VVPPVAEAGIGCAISAVFEEVRNEDFSGLGIDAVHKSSFATAIGLDHVIA